VHCVRERNYGANEAMNGSESGELKLFEGGTTGDGGGNRSNTSSSPKRRSPSASPDGASVCFGGREYFGSIQVA